MILLQTLGNSLCLSNLGIIKWFSSEIETKISEIGNTSHILIGNMEKFGCKLDQIKTLYRKIPSCLWHIDVGLHTFIFLL